MIDKMDRCIILDYEEGVVRVIDIKDNLQIEDVEKILVERYDYSLNSIEYMVVKDLKLIID